MALELPIFSHMRCFYLYYRVYVDVPVLLLRSRFFISHFPVFKLTSTLPPWRAEEYSLPFHGC